MFRRTVAVVLIGTTLGSCSYAYGLLATVEDGQLTLVVKPGSDHPASCFREVEVVAERGVEAQPQAGDDISRVASGTFWFESVNYDDDCANRFPLRYGSSLRGRHMGGIVKAKPLRREVVYDVSTTSDATGYGSGRFIVHANGQIQNLAIKGSPMDASSLLENAN